MLNTMEGSAGSNSGWLRQGRPPQHACLPPAGSPVLTETVGAHMHSPFAACLGSALPLATRGCVPPISTMLFQNPWSYGPEYGWLRQGRPPNTPPSTMMLPAAACQFHPSSGGDQRGETLQNLFEVLGALKAHIKGCLLQVSRHNSVTIPSHGTVTPDCQHWGQHGLPPLTSHT